MTLPTATTADTSGPPAVHLRTFTDPTAPSTVQIAAGMTLDADGVTLVDFAAGKAAAHADATETHALAGSVKLERVSLYDAAGAQIATLPVSLTSTTITGTVAATQSGTWSLGVSSAVIGHVVVDSAAGVVVTSLPAVTFAAPQHVIVDSATLGTVTISGAVTLTSTTITGTVAVTQSGTWTVGLSSGSNTIGKVDQGAAGASAWLVAFGSAQHVIVDSATLGTVTVSGAVTTSGTVTEASGSAIATSTGTTATQITAAAASLVSILARQSDGTQSAIAKGAAATGAAVSGNPVYIAGIDGAGKAQGVRVNASGFVETQPALGTGSQSAAFEASHVIASAACEPARVIVYNTNGLSRNLQVFNATSLPGNGAIPYDNVLVNTKLRSGFTYSLPTGRFSVGLVAALSTTDTTLTVTTTTDGLFSWDLFPPSA